MPLKFAPFLRLIQPEANTTVSTQAFISHQQHRPGSAGWRCRTLLAEKTSAHFAMASWWLKPSSMTLAIMNWRQSASCWSLMALLRSGRTARSISLGAGPGYTFAGRDISVKTWDGGFHIPAARKPSRQSM